ncbi:guanine deaminase [Galdieria sulphuraria]|uniref:Guanine deaminase n=1 Tax=Galdieria sulphuraria TaxID=130081 RepID=M2WUJ7_GALSU|nr:guanine deaminase [Galdieria sulphuraria]EME27615.1 guanine deaminase [Galdieria sulphuraria]|eukprot:XP_005704135.1 guanine deaminase [Galdieria sulphuraria]
MLPRFQGLSSGDGGPFGAVIVLDGKVIVQEHNRVLSSNDPTAHAEVVAIRKACQILKTLQLQDCFLYASCQPCPMCFGAIHWSRIASCRYAATSKDAAQAGFDDQLLYDKLSHATQEEPYDEQSSPSQYLHIEHPRATEAFQLFADMLKQNKTRLY